MKQDKLLEMAGVISQNIIDGKPEEARTFLRKHPRAVKKIREYYAALREYDETKEDAQFWRQHAGIAQSIVDGVIAEAKRPVAPTASRPMNAEQIIALHNASHPGGGPSIYQKGPCVYGPNDAKTKS